MTDVREECGAPAPDLTCENCWDKLLAERDALKARLNEAERLGDFMANCAPRVGQEWKRWRRGGKP